LKNDLWTLVALLCALSFGTPTVARGDTGEVVVAARAAEDEAAAAEGESDSDAEAKPKSPDPTEQLRDAFTRPVPGQEILGPNWLDQFGEAPRHGPGRKNYRPDAPIDVLYMAGGNIIRGHLIAEEFDDHLSIVTEGGVVFTVPEAAVQLRKKERALVANRGTRSHRKQFGILVSGAFAGGVCVSINGNCPPGAADAAGTLFSGFFETVPLTGKAKLRLTYAFTPALELALGVNLFRIPGTGDVGYEPTLGFRYYTNVFDPIKFLRVLDLTFGVQDGFSLGIDALAGFQFDIARNVGIYGVLGPQVQMLPNFIIGFTLGAGLQARFP
jgi:hypothetical protein